MNVDVIISVYPAFRIYTLCRLQLLYVSNYYTKVKK